MIVMKFGGTSVEDSKAITRVASIVRSRLEQGPVVVVSAMGGVTDVLVAMGRGAATGKLAESLRSLESVRDRHFKAAEELSVSAQVRPQLEALFNHLEVVLRGIAALGELSPRTMDNVMSFGEVCSSTMVSAAFNVLGINAVLADARECLITNSAFTRAVPNFELTNERMQAKLQPLLAESRVPGYGRLHRLQRRRHYNDARTRRLRLFGFHHRRGAVGRGHRNLDRREGRNDHRPAPLPGGAKDR